MCVDNLHKLHTLTKSLVDFSSGISPAIAIRFNNSSNLFDMITPVNNEKNTNVCSRSEQVSKTTFVQSKL